MTKTVKGNVYNQIHGVNILLTIMKVVEVTRNTFYKLPYEDGKTKYRYVVTALDRLHNESKSVAKKVKL